ncbi:MAG: hypothetical protein IBX64_00990 [Actinobacteria bacterium]|nr:hypothetical protein [Actinomycetota bacterium]
MKPLVEQAKNEYAGKITFEVYDLGNQDQDSVNVVDQYGVGPIPTLIFIDKDGLIANKVVGEVPKDVIDKNVKNIIE